MQLNLQLFRKVSRKKIVAGVLIFGLIVSTAALSVTRSRNGAGIPVKTAKAEVKSIQDNVFAQEGSG